MKKSIGSVIRELRKDKCISQIKLAEKAEISNTYLSDIENGRTEPSMRTIRKIAKALNINWVKIFIYCDEHVNNERKNSREK